MNNICEAISRSIKEGKWLQVTYQNELEKKDTSFWCAIKDIYPKKKLFKVSIFNNAYSQDCKEGYIYFDKIKEAQIIELTTYDTNQQLIEKIEENPLDYEWLEYFKFDNNILMYLLECVRLDTDPFQKHYAMISGIDLHVLQENKKIVLSPQQIDEMVKLIFYNDIEKFEQSYNELILSALSIDVGKKKYVLAYYKLVFDPSKKELSLGKDIKFNETFLYDNNELKTKFSLHNYTELSCDEFKSVYIQNPLEAYEILRENFNKGEMIDTRPDIMILERDIPVNLGNLFENIQMKYDANMLPIPLRAFFGDVSRRNNGKKEPKIVIYDNRVNIDQINVLYSAMKNPVTYVQGPPGTGKTQTLFNVILSAYFADKTSLVVSNNNRPIEGIIEKLSFKHKNDKVPFPFLRLGNNEYLIEATLKIRNDFLTQFKGRPDNEKIEKIKTIEANKNSELVRLLSKYIERKDISDSLEMLKGTLTYFKDKEQPQIIKKTIAELEEKLKNTEKISNEQVLKLFEPAKNSVKYQSYLYYSSIAHLNKLKGKAYKELIEIVMIEDNLTRVSQFNAWCKDDSNIKLLSDVYPLIFTTNISANRLGTSDFTFDLVVMDEAGQADIAKSLIPIARGKSLLLVGDEDQLKPVILIENSTNEKLMEKYKIGRNYNYVENSILSTMSNVDNVSKNILLSYHYRCGSKIIGFSNQYFYDNKLKTHDVENLGNVSVVDVDNKTKGVNRHEAVEEAIAIVDYCKRNEVKDAIIITPFTAQENLINKLLLKQGVTGVSACTIHRIQGGEANTVILSYALSKRTSDRTFAWLNAHPEIANVAITRAKKNLVIFADNDALSTIKSETVSVWKELVKYAKENGNYEVVRPIVDNIEIGKSNGSTNEDELYRTMAMLCTVNKRITIERNVSFKDFFAEDALLKTSGQEFDVVVYEKHLFSKPTPKYAFEVNGGEHMGDLKRESLDIRKQKVCKEKKIKIFYIDNANVKNYELIRHLILTAYKKKTEDTITLLD